MSDSFHGRDTVLLQTHFILEKTQSCLERNEMARWELSDFYQSVTGVTTKVPESVSFEKGLRFES